MTIPGSIQIEDAKTGSRAHILSGLGFNCFSFQPLVNGKRIEVLWAAPDFGQPKAALLIAEFRSSSHSPED